MKPVAVILNDKELVRNVIMSIPYKWWKKFNDSEVIPAMTIEKPVEGKIVDELHRKLKDFRRAYDVNGMTQAEFAGYGASVHTLNQFLGGYQKFLELVRERML
ncbi:MAG: hypothetical protein KKH28_07550 [Elusimicrobia bacterium]|nr:hypothetical protein [Elusimicrobiota bacterium]